MDGTDGTDVEDVRGETDSSVYSQAVFLDVPQSYSILAPIVCTYHLTGGLKPGSKDWIGIFKVGWDTTQKYYSYVWADIASDQSGPGPLKMQVVFKESYLPKDDGEFYQFCYVDSGGQVRGASTPFCFQNPTEGSVDSSLETDILVVATQEQIGQMEREKEDLQAKLHYFEEQNGILKNELDERLREIHRLRVNIALESNATSETHLVEKQKPKKVVQQQQPLVDGENETKANLKSLSHVSEKYEEALQKITMLKQERAQLKCLVEAQKAEIKELRSTVKKSEQHINRVQDQLQLLQVDMQSSRKENERLHAELEQQMVMKKDLERLQEENKALNATLLEKGVLEGDTNNTKMQIQTLITQLSEARAALRKEIQNSNEANLHAEKAELELRELKIKLEQKSVAGDITEDRHQIETELVEARRRIAEQTNMAEVAQTEKENLFEENKKLKEEMERLQNLMCELEMASIPPVVNNPQQHESLPAFSATSDYENINDMFGLPSESIKVCRHCQESFPDISDHELSVHEQSHKVCPFCTLICDDYCQQQFENHVYSHED